MFDNKVNEFISGFITKAQQIPLSILPHETRLSMYLARLTPEYREKIALQQPTTLEQAIAQTRTIYNVRQQNRSMSRPTQSTNPASRFTRVARSKGGKSLKRSSYHKSKLNLLTDDEADSEHDDHEQLNKIDFKLLTSEQQSWLKERKCLKCGMYGLCWNDCKNSKAKYDNLRQLHQLSYSPRQRSNNIYNHLSYHDNDNHETPLDDNNVEQSKDSAYAR
jgi:radical SAM protein with 4Fe4S-binding SPASM domain